jgi:catechol 2,3-dioxygenase-like lactoylglutathione lyase family enzyme
MAEAKKGRAVGLNHVALEVGDIEQALAFYGQLFDFKLRGKSATSAFIDLGDCQLVAQFRASRGAFGACRKRAEKRTTGWLGR